MIKLPRIVSKEQASCIARYRAALDQHGLPMFGNARENRKAMLDAAFALGLTCGLELAKLPPPHGFAEEAEVA